MIDWSLRAPEERSLLNPAFCGLLLSHAAGGYFNERGLPLPFELSFLVLPLVLHKETRDSLPRSVATSLVSWLSDQPLVQTRIAARASTLVPFTREALLFGALHGLLAVSAQAVRPTAEWRVHLPKTLADTSDEVRACAKKAEFVGKWFEKAGRAETVMALFGVQP